MRDPKDSTRKPLDLANPFSKGYKNKSVVFLYTNNKDVNNQWNLLCRPGCDGESLANQ